MISCLRTANKKKKQFNCTQDFDRNMGLVGASYKQFAEHH